MLLLVSGCSEPAVELLTPPEPPVVWPKPPDQARVRYLGELKSSEDLHRRKRFSERWNDLVYGPKEPSRLVSPHAVAVHPDGQRVAIADTNGKCVHVFNLSDRSYVRKDGCGQPPESFECPVAVAWADEALWVADSQLHAVGVIEAFGEGRFIGRDQLTRPAGLAFCRTNQLCYVCDAGAHAVLAFDRSGKLIAQFGSRGTGPGQFNFPSHIACGPGASGGAIGGGGSGGSEEVLVLVDSLNFRVQRLSLTGSPLGVFGRKGDAAGDLALPKGAALGPDGNIWVVDAQFENVQAFSPEGKLLMSLGSEGQGAGQFWLPGGICIDAKRRLWVADTYNRRVQVFELLP
ncbi:MAG: hypothetical protein JXQ73_13935 [Phycisphaerae bacterium]|nr:hypothetical protein [Phycisphaerae bacterium]